jgi:hypothetical protein
MGMTHIKFASQKKAKYSMPMAGSFHHVKHKVVMDVLTKILETIEVL